MSTSARTKKLILLSCACIVALSVIAYFLCIKTIDESRRLWGADKRTIQAKEAAFKGSPTIENAMSLMDRFLFIGTYRKVIFYGNKCEALGLEKQPRRAMYVNYWMAIAYNKIGDPEVARKYLEKAVELDGDLKFQKYKLDLIDKHGLKDIYESIQPTRKNKRND